MLKGHEMIVKSLANDGTDTVVSGGWDGRVLAWKVGRWSGLPDSEKFTNYSRQPWDLGPH